MNFLGGSKVICQNLFFNSESRFKFLANILKSNPNSKAVKTNSNSKSKPVKTNSNANNYLVV